MEHLASVLEDVGQAIIAQKLTEKFTCHNDVLHCHCKVTRLEEAAFVYTHVQPAVKLT